MTIQTSIQRIRAVATGPKQAGVAGNKRQVFAADLTALLQEYERLQAAGDAPAGASAAPALPQLLAALALGFINEFEARAKPSVGVPVLVKLSNGKARLGTHTGSAWRSSAAPGRYLSGKRNEHAGAVPWVIGWMPIPGDESVDANTLAVYSRALGAAHQN